mmetsp:Transcript_60165/g.130483  ORF Transcript_60165/g.130483 Transcript_60165/m.130483 type:complete len:282 (-) Transcript_60165:30-875(-)
MAPSEQDAEDQEWDEEDDEAGETICDRRPGATTGLIDDESDEEVADDLLQQACLPVSGAPLPPGDEPAKDADEYLRRVQWERLHCAQVVDAEVEEQPRPRKRRPVFGTKGSLLKGFGEEIPEALQPKREWAEDVAGAFRDLRTRCDELRRGYPGETQNITFEAWRQKLKEQPRTELLAAQDFLSINQLVVVAVEAFIQKQESAASGQPEGESGTLAEWVFAALAFVEEPLMDDIQYQLQRLRRGCVTAINAEKDIQESSPTSRRAEASLLMALAGEVFGQR